MRVNAKKTKDFEYNSYMHIPFDKLAETVFDENGDHKRCSRKADKALIRRLEEHYGTNGFGNAEIGELNEMDAYLACALILGAGGNA